MFCFYVIQIFINHVTHACENYMIKHIYNSSYLQFINLYEYTTKDLVDATHTYEINQISRQYPKKGTNSSNT